MTFLGMISTGKKIVSTVAVARLIAAFIAKVPRTYMGTAAYQVRAVPAGGVGGWMIAERGSATPLEIFAKKSDALFAAKRLAREHKAHLDVYSRQGALQTHLSFA